MKNSNSSKQITLSESELKEVKRYLAEANLYFKKKIVAKSYLSEKALALELNKQTEEFNKINEKFI